MKRFKIVFVKGMPDPMVYSPEGEDISGCIRAITWTHEAGADVIVALTGYAEVEGRA